jgi:hypothetical protein
MDIRKDLGQQAVAGHGIKYAALAHEHDEDNRAKPQQDRNGDEDRQPAISRHISLDGIGDGGLLALFDEIGIRSYTGENKRKEYI